MFDYIVKRIDDQPGDFKDWIFDGASLLPDNLISKLFHIPHLIEIASSMISNTPMANSATKKNG